MNNHILIFNNHIARGMDTLESIIMMICMSLATPLVGALVKIIVDIFKGASKYIKDAYELYLDNKYNSVEIVDYQIYNGKAAMWVSVSDNKYNNALIASILQYLSVHKITCNKARYNLGKGNPSLFNRDYERSQIIETVPRQDVDVNGFKISYCEDLDIGSGKSDSTNKRVLTIKSNKSAQEINKFVRECYDEYVLSRSMESIQCVGQHLYKQVAASGSYPKYNRYLMNNKATFDDIFVPELDDIIELAERFKNGRLNKLSLLLHGAPGCGKTSIIRALANYLGFSIVEIKLSLLKSDAQLIEIFHNPYMSYWNHIFDRDCEVDRMTDDAYIPTNKRIYVLEDIDAECDIVHERANDSSDKEERARNSPQTIIINSGRDRRLDDDMNDDGKQSLTLAGILNAFDGILELNSVIVMTTNYVAKLDAALIRSGRVTRAIELKKMTSRNAYLLIEKYFGANDIVIEDYLVTPADLDAICQTARNVGEVKARLNEALMA